MRKKIAIIAAIVPMQLLLCVNNANAVLGIGDIVNDPLHLMSNLMQFTNSLTAAGENILAVEKVWNKTAETAAFLKETKENLEKVNKWLLDAKEIEEAAADIVDMADMMATLTKMIRDATVHTSIDGSSFTAFGEALGLEEKAAALDVFSSALVRATNDAKVLVDYIKDEKYKLNDWERMLGIAQRKEKLRAERRKMENGLLAAKKSMDERNNQRAALDAVLSGILKMSPTDVAALATVYEEGEDSHGMADIVVAAASILGTPEKKAKESKETVIGKVRGVAGYFFTLYYGICALVGLIGAYKVYSMVQRGEDFGKTAGVWFGTALMAFFLGMLVQLFFFE